ncbi:XrtA/PEP-CTERM system histidine kinase PrsK [Geomesophilobacter sediminis]|uniref:histidine kinase n=1 Tax=Geomesophilobacter sediminis TaxID=2798584 RepID=A0A8J7JGR5_9BACT|nr:XrtA/PEP-CTERM system histidine kinase PrsK [Geomesophilobacter sediminis]MBJ6723705.1 PEP-CTERM system histidine kinase PrsK [Geomesophilobacter sediminis]
MVVTLISIIVLLAFSVQAVLRKRNHTGLYLTAPLFMTALLELFDLCALTGVVPSVPWKNLSGVVEGVLPHLWLVCSLTYARAEAPGGLGWRLKGFIGAASLLCLVPLLFPAGAIYYAPDFPAERLLFLSNVGFIYYVVIMVILVAALINLEHTLTYAGPEALWRVKLDLVALGSMLAVMIFYYSHALLYRTINMEYVPLRSVMFVVAVGMMTYSRTHWRGGARITVSRTVAYRSVTFAVVALYLILLGGLGEGMRHFGPLFPRVVTVSLAFLLGMGLLMVLLSPRVMREVKVYLHKNFYQSKFDYRAQWLSLTERLATFDSENDLMKKVLVAYCDTFGVKGGGLFLHQPGCGWYCATSVREMESVHEILPEDNLLVAYLKDRRWVFFRQDDNPAILAESGEFLDRHRISFVIPLFAADSFIGFIVLGELVAPDESFRYEDFDLMKTMARQASLAIQHQHLSQELTQAKSLEAVGNLATFVVHDLKNQLATVSLIVENARQHIHNPEFQQDLLVSLGNTVEKMQRLIGRLRNLGESEFFALKSVDLLELCRKCAKVMGEGVAVNGTSQFVPVDEGEIQKVVLNLIINGIEASQGARDVQVEVGFQKAPFIRVSDHGCGMSPAFLRTQLFMPFQTTKKKGLGIGLYQCRQIVEAHGGRIEVKSVEGKGSDFTIWFPPPEPGAAGLAAVA